MRALHIVIVATVFFYIGNNSYAQTEEVADATVYKAEILGSVASGI